MKKHVLIMTSCLLSGVAVADSTLIYNNQNGSEVSRMMLTDGWVKMEQSTEGDTALIFDAKNTAFTVLNHADRSYLRFGKKEIEALSNVSTMVDKMLEEQLAQMPAAQREQMRGMMESMIKSQMPKQKPTPSYSKSGKTGDYNGFSCEMVLKQTQGQPDDAFCVTSHQKLGISSEEFQAVQDFMAVAEKLANQFGQDQSMNFSAIGQVVPVYYEMGSVKAFLTDVSHDELDGNTFKVPEGYRKESLPEMF